MKYIIIGLGNFGSSLGEKLTQAGNEVIGVDTNMTKVNAYKEKISHTICMDATDSYTVSGLPLKDTDVVIVAIGEDQGANIMATAVLKKTNPKRLISRAITPLHETVLQAIGVDEIVHPEEETAERWAKKLCFQGVVDSFEVNDKFSIVEVKAKSEMIGKTLEEIKLRSKYNLIVLTIIREVKRQTFTGRLQNFPEVQGIATPQSSIDADDVLVIFGSNKDIKRLLESA